MTTRVRHLQPGQLPEPGKPVGSGAGQPAVLAALAAAPTPPAQATDSVQDLQPVHDAVTIDLLNERVAYLERKLQEADSVLEDADAALASATLKALGAQKAVAWARPVFATEAVEPFDKGDLVDVEFYNHPERPEGEGWRPLVFADTDDARAACKQGANHDRTDRRRT